MWDFQEEDSFDIKSFDTVPWAQAQDEERWIRDYLGGKFSISFPPFCVAKRGSGDSKIQHCKLLVIFFCGVVVCADSAQRIANRLGTFWAGC